MHRAWTKPVTVSSDYSRANAQYIAQAASLGYISSVTHAGLATNEWYVTEAGMRYLEVAYGL